MRLRLQSGLAIAFISSVAAVFLVLGIVLTGYIEHRNQHQASTQLRRETLLAAQAAVPVVAGSASLDAQALVQQLAANSGATVALFGPTGSPLADSSGNLANTPKASIAPEISTALRGNVTSTQREDAQTGAQTRYVAAPVVVNGRVSGAIRLAVPSANLAADRSGEPGVIALLLFAAAAATLIVVAAVTRFASRPLSKIVSATQRVSLGDMTARAPEEGGGDFVDLAIAFNEMADELQATFDTIELERTRLVSIVEHLGDGIVIVDDEGKIVLMNRAAERLLGFLRDRAIGRSYAQVFRDYELVAVVRDAQTSPSAVATPGERFIELGRPRRAVQAFAYPIPSDDIQLVLVVLRDITEFRRTEAVRRDFVANVSHDLRTPIASLKALVETLLDGALEDETVAREFLSRMQVEVDDLARLVEELLQLSRAEAGQIQLNTAPGNLVSVANRVAERLRAQASLKRITLTVESPVDLPRAMFDSDRIEQVLVNLVHNAIKFTPPDGNVTIRVTSSDDEVLVAVADSGPGIDSRELDRVFERFYKADRSRTASGSGLGLAIAKHLIQLHGGRIWAESDYGHGSTFSFALPQARFIDLQREEQLHAHEASVQSQSDSEATIPPAIRNSTSP